jgi:hypothetical protein
LYSKTTPVYFTQHKTMKKEKTNQCLQKEKKNFFNTSTPDICYMPPKSSKNSNKTIFGPSDLFIIGHNFLGHALYKGPNKFFHNMDFMGIKRWRILRRFQKYKHT